MSRILNWIVIFPVMTVIGGCAGVRCSRPGPVLIDRMPVGGIPSAARRSPEVSLDTEPLTARKRTHPMIGRLRGRGSLSIGTPVRGFIFSSAELPLSGVNHRVMPEQAGRATRFGTDDLVAAILKAADDVAKRYPGSVLQVGNLSRDGGGDIVWSLSHRSGRDADLGFYLSDGRGHQVFQDGMSSVGRDGKTWTGSGYAVFDDSRNWFLVRSLLTSSRVSVQWIFMADHLRERLLAHARRIGEKPGLVERAAQAIAQPRGLNHDDHIHLRIYCPVDDLLEGCVDIGSNRPWYEPPGEVVSRRRNELLRLSRSRDAAVRRDAVEVLGHFGDRRVLGSVARALRDPDADVRRAAAGALDWLGISGVEGSLAVAVEDLATPDDVAIRLLGLLTTAARNGAASNRAAQALAGLLASNRILTVDNGVFVTTVQVGSEASAAAGVQEALSRAVGSGSKM